MSGNQETQQEARNRYMSIGVAIGMPVFSLAGIILCIATDNFGMLGVWPGLGLAVGITIGEGLYQRSQQRQDG